MSTEVTRTVITDYIAALAAGQAADRRAEFFTEDATWTLHGDLPVSRTWKGRDEIFTGFLTQMLARFDLTAPVSQDVHNVLADGDHAVAEWTTHATTIDGAPFTNHVTIVFRITNGRIAEAREYFDTAYVGRLLFGRE
ncbi:nuclear transport factor 2 family protein [Nocardia sp. NBC_01327]|uniref:nuclear transport factor 2 family protein n=1 Tax=Nocardia sp. NBC_01327 TaxID=2903593 RepID=UPI002E115179|nr:nuclear transport factor 2 family protein [Nocardia sp. NBC_01327]